MIPTKGEPLFNNELRQSIDTLVKGIPRPTQKEYCRFCKNPIESKSIWDRDLGGPYCKPICLENARIEAMYDSRELSQDEVRH